MDADTDIEKARNHFLRNKDIIFGDDIGAGSRVRGVGKESRVSSIARHGVSSVKDCKFILALAKLCPATVCIELGTSLGISTAYLAKSRHFEKVYSFEGNAALVQHAHELLSAAHCDNYKILEGNIDHQLPVLLRKVSNVGFVIIDANHTSQALLRYFDLLVNKMRPDGAMLVDDIRWSTDMYGGWNKLVARKEVTLSLEYMQKGVLFFKEGIPKQHYIVSG